MFKFCATEVQQLTDFPSSKEKSQFSLFPHMLRSCSSADKTSVCTDKNGAQSCFVFIGSFRIHWCVGVCTSLSVCLELLHLHWGMGKMSGDILEVYLVKPLIIQNLCINHLWDRERCLLITGSAAQPPAPVGNTLNPRLILLFESRCGKKHKNKSSSLKTRILSNKGFIFYLIHDWFPGKHEFNLHKTLEFFKIFFR